MIECDQRIDILLASYNGELYIRQMIDSIFSQSYKNWQLYIRDDCSTDRTISIINDLASRFPDKIVIVPNEGKRIGVIGNFQALMCASTANLIMLADQDDIWFENKISTTIECVHNVNILSDLFLIHTDLSVADSNLNLISPSLSGYQAFTPHVGHSTARLIVQNVVTGCTVLMNRKLLELCLPIPKEAIMHDWWIALVASTFGRIYYLDQSTMLYRQHGKNDTGAKEFNIINAVRNGFNASEIAILKNSVAKTRQQAAAFFRIYGDSLPSSLRIIFSEYSELERRSYFVRLITAFKYGFRKHGFLRNIGFYLFL